MLNKKIKISVIGQGYVGLPLTIELGKRFNRVIGFDNSLQRIKQINQKIDANKEVSKLVLKKAKNIKFTNIEADIKNSDFFIVTVPTPINNKKLPDLESIRIASKIVGNQIKKNSIVIYESTVFPGCTEEICVPILEKNSGLKYNRDFFCGYSPERINVGDKRFVLTKIKKVVSGSTPKIAKKINNLYSSIIDAGTYVAKSIKVAEAAKVIENTQRDLNIALINELSIIFKKMNLDTTDVLDAAATKWNFIKYKPGLVGGHCIGVDPYYLTYKSKKVGYNPKLILSGRKLNDNMSNFVSLRIKKLMDINKIKINNAKVLILGCAFKKNCTDTRNSKIFDLAKFLKSSKMIVDIYDPWVEYKILRNNYDFKFLDKINKKYDVLVLGVGHDIFKKFTSSYIKKIMNKKKIIYDVKSFLKKEIVTERL